MGKPSKHREAHRVAEALTRQERGHAASAAQVGDHDPPRRSEGIERPQGADDVLERRSVKAVAPYARVEVLSGKRVEIGNQGGGPVECRVEARHLNQPRAAPLYRADGSEVVRLVGRGKGHKGSQGIECGPVDDDRLGVERPAMDDAVADPHELQAGPVGLDPGEDLVHRVFLCRDFFFGEVRIHDADAPLGREEAGGGADPFELAAVQQVQVRAGDREHGELDARRSGVQDADYLGHRATFESGAWT